MLKPSFPFTNKTALLTGGGKRLGAAIAEQLTASGCRVIIHYHQDREAAENLVSRLNHQHTGSALTLAADFSDETKLPEFFTKIKTAVETIDYLINNAAIYPENNLANVEFADLTAALKINCFAPLALAREFAKQANPGAAIINLLDARMHGNDRGHLAYLFSKRQLFALTKMQAAEYAPQIRVNGVAPGLILPPNDLLDSQEQAAWLNRRAESNPLKKNGTAEQVASAVHFLLMNDFITGEVLHIDGGRHLRDRFYE